MQETYKIISIFFISFITSIDLYQRSEPQVKYLTLCYKWTTYFCGLYKKWKGKSCPSNEKKKM